MKVVAEFIHVVAGEFGARKVDDDHILQGIGAVEAEMQARRASAAADLSDDLGIQYVVTQRVLVCRINRDRG